MRKNNVTAVLPCERKGVYALRKLYRSSLLIFMRSKALLAPYLVLLILLLGLFTFCFSNYRQWGDIFSTMIWLVRPAILVIAFFIYCGYELAVKIHETCVAEYVGSYEYWRMVLCAW